MYIRTIQWYIETFRTYGFSIVEREKHIRKQDGYNDEMMFCLLPISVNYVDSSMNTNDEVDAVCVVGKSTRRFCCGQDCFEKEFKIKEEEKSLFSDGT